MSIDWLNKRIYEGAPSVFNRVTLEDLAGGIGLLTIEVGKMVEIMSKWLLMKNKITNKQYDERKMFELCRTKKEIDHSTLGPIIHTILDADPEFKRDESLLYTILNDRNYFQHEFVRNYVQSPNMDLTKQARRLIKSISIVRKINNRYSNIVNDRAPIKKNPSNAVKKKGRRINVSDEKLRSLINHIIRETVGEGNSIHLSKLEAELKNHRVYVEDYSTDIRSFVIRLGFSILD